MQNARKNITISLPKKMVENIRKGAIELGQPFEDIIEEIIKESDVYHRIIKDE